MKKAPPFYISTALPYVNAGPHIGHALEFVEADLVARYHRLLGEDVFFLTGTDENALKNVLAAQALGVSPREFVRKNSEKFQDLTHVLHISHDDFIRTTEDRHIRGAQKLWSLCRKEDITRKTYEGLYCVGCEEFYKENELEGGLCPEHKTKPDYVKEENYFFRLSAYGDSLYNLIASDTLRIIPGTRKNEILRFIERGLDDFSISRSNERVRNWGVPVPGDDTQRIYVWIDALSNYINALGYADNKENFSKFWQGNENTILHCIGKGITRFHAIYWPAILLSAGIRLPTTIFVHGYLTVDGEKMSKSLENVTDPKAAVMRYGTDPVRYYLLREFSPFEDGDFDYKNLEERYESDLANGLGNLVSRVLTLASKLSHIPKANGGDFKGAIDSAWDEYRSALSEFRLGNGLEAIWRLIHISDEYLNREEPWRKDIESDEFRRIIHSLLVVLANIAWLLRPYLPETSEKIFARLGIDPASDVAWNEQEFQIKKGEALFPRLT